MWWLISAALLNTMGYMAVPFLSLYLVNVLHLPMRTMGALLGVAGVGTIAGSWIGGKLGDRFGPSASLSASLAVAAAGLLAVAATDEVIVVAIGIAVFSAAGGAFRPAFDAGIVRICGRGLRTTAYAVYVVAINLGAAFATGVAGLAYAASPTLVFHIDAATSLLAAAVVLLAGAIGGPAETDAPIAPPTDTSDRYAGSPYRHGAFMLACLASFVFEVTARQSTATLPIYVGARYDLSAETFGALLAAGHFVFAVAFLPASGLVERHRPTSMIVAGLALVAVCCLTLPLASDRIFLVANYLVMTVGKLVFYPAIMAVAMDHASRTDGRVGAFMGAYRTIQAAAGVCAPVVGAWIYAEAGPEVLWIGCGLACMAFALVHAVTAATRSPKSVVADEP